MPSEKAKCALVEKGDINSLLQFVLFPFSFHRAVFPSEFHLFHASLLLSTPPAFFFFFSLCLCLPSPFSRRVAFSRALPPLARSCKWLPANGLSEEKTDLNEEWRQKREQRGSKRRCAQKRRMTVGNCVCFPYVCVFEGLYCTVGSSPRLEGNPLPRLYHWECQE